MVTTGAKGSTVNQSQVSCALGQQALEGRRVPRMSSGRTMPSFAPYDPNPRADGFITDRFLTGVRPQEYYFHCMAGREGLVDTAVKTSRSGYLQRCLVKHLEELKVCYDHTVRDGEGGVVQFLYGEDGIDPMKAAHLDGSSTTLQYMARNHKALAKRHIALPRSTLDLAEADCNQTELIEKNSPKLFEKGAFVHARKLKFGDEWRRGALCCGWHPAQITKVRSGRKLFDLQYTEDDSKVSKVPIEVHFSYAGGRHTKAISSMCTIIKPAVRDPILSDTSKNRGGHRIGSSGACVSEKIAGDLADAIMNDDKLKSAMKSNNLSAADLKQVVSAKYSSALVAPGEAVGCIAAQSIGEPSTQMTLNTFHLAGAGANVTLGIPRLREIIMTASRTLKTPTMSVPLRSSVSDKDALKLTRYFTRLTLSELISSRGGISVRESLQQSVTGSWERAYVVTLKLQRVERIREAFGLKLEDIAAVVTSTFIPNLSRIMNMELKRSGQDDGSSISKVLGGEKSEFLSAEPSNKKMNADELDEDDDDDGDDDGTGIEDGVSASKFGRKKEMDSYGEMDEDEKKIQRSLVEDGESSEPPAITDDEDEGQVSEPQDALNAVRVDRKRNCLVLQALRVDPSARPLLMVGLVERAATKTLVRTRPAIECGYINEEDGRGRCLQTAGCNFEEIWKLRQVDHDKLMSNDIWAVRCSYGVEAARMSIVEQIRGVFAVYGISVDPRHLTLIADYMTYDGGYKAMNRIGMADASSSFLQMSFETTAQFMIDAAMNNRDEPMNSPSANIVLGRPIKHGTGAFECIVKA
jgi:DNA-directed RNA polymerase I subunit RPA1